MKLAKEMFYPQTLSIHGDSPENAHGGWNSVTANALPSAVCSHLEHLWQTWTWKRFAVQSIFFQIFCHAFDFPGSMDDNVCPYRYDIQYKKVSQNSLNVPAPIPNTLLWFISFCFKLFCVENTTHLNIFCARPTQRNYFCEKLEIQGAFGI